MRSRNPFGNPRAAASSSLLEYTESSPLVTLNTIF